MWYTLATIVMIRLGKIILATFFGLICISGVFLFSDRRTVLLSVPCDGFHIEVTETRGISHIDSGPSYALEYVSGWVRRTIDVPPHTHGNNFPSYYKPEHFVWFSPIKNPPFGAYAIGTPADAQPTPYWTIEVNHSSTSGRFTLPEYENIRTCVQANLPVLNSKIFAVTKGASLGAIAYFPEGPWDYDAETFTCPGGENQILVDSAGVVYITIPRDGYRDKEFLGTTDEKGFFVRDVHSSRFDKVTEYLKKADSCVAQDGTNIHNFLDTWRTAHTKDFL